MAVRKLNPLARGKTLRVSRLRRSDCSGPGITRRRRGKGFEYLDEDGARIDEPEVLERIRELGIPPAWKNVWVCPYPFGHLQATGVDAAGRKQYLYHQRWRARRDAEKFDDMVRFAHALPDLRERVEDDLDGDELTHARVLACAVRLLDRGFFRIGSEEYTVQNESYGLATMRKSHVTLSGECEMVFDYPRQERAASRAGHHRPASRTNRRRAQAAPRRRRRSCSRTRTAAAGATCAQRRSTPTSRKRPAPTSRPRTSAPGMPPCSPPSPCRCPARSRVPRPVASARSPARSRRSRTTSATRRRCAAPPTSTRACSTPTAAGW